jgi:hypothetical protein
LRNAERVAAPSLPPPELQAIPLAPSDLTGGAGAADDAAREAEKRQRELERLQNQQQQMILANAELQAKLQEIEFNEGKDIAEEKFSFIRRLIDAEYDYRLSKANEIQAVQLRLEKQLSDSRLSALESVENALMRIEEARFRSKIAGQNLAAAQAVDAILPVSSLAKVFQCLCEQTCLLERLRLPCFGPPMGGQCRLKCEY